MSRDFPTVDGNTNLENFVNEFLVRTGRRFFIVTLNGRPEGLITPKEVSTVEQNRWPFTTVLDVMKRLGESRSVVVETPVTDALEMMGREDVNQLVVVKDSEVCGVISRSHVLQLLQTRNELHI